MRPPGTAAEVERRRRFTLSDLDNGHSVLDIAEFLGVSERAVYYWHAAHRQHGQDGVKATTAAPAPQALARSGTPGPRLVHNCPVN